MTKQTSPLLYGSIMDEEISIETESSNAGVVRYQKQCENAIKRGEGSKLKPMEKMMLSWWEQFVLEIRAEQKACRMGLSGVGRGVYGKTINLVDAKKIALIAMNEITSLCLIDINGATMRKVSYSVGSAIIAEIHACAMKDRKCTPKELDLLICGGTMSSKEKVRAYNHAAKMTMEDHVWDRRVCTLLGSSMIWRLIGVASVPSKNGSFERAICVRKKFRNGKSENVIELSQTAKDCLEHGNFLRKTLRPRFMPMVAPPLNWSQSDDGNINEGGHYRLRTPFVVKPSSSLRKRLTSADLKNTFSAVNAISSTPWIVNKKMLSVIKTLMDSGGGVAGLPMLNQKKLPERPAKGCSLSEKKEYGIAARAVHEINEKNASARGDLLLGLSVAERMAEYSAIWFPHQLDFRGRSYPVPIHFNHMMDDSRRGMLLFAEAKELTKDGIRWLKIHCATRWGHGIDKCDYGLRESWAESNMGKIVDWANNPLLGSGWMEAEEPFQFLQACMAIVDPSIGSRMPIHFDGTANGMQHLAAIGLDKVGGESVNLVPRTFINDIYSDIAELTKKTVSMLASDGDQMASKCEPFICRSLVKQPVMTSVYGVTRSGTREQMIPRLIDQGAKRGDAVKMAHWLSGIVVGVLSNQCGGAVGIMDWLQKSVKDILKHNKKCAPIEWTSPLGFPVLQPYWNQKSSTIHCHLNSISLRVPNESDKQNVRRNVNGIVANYIHTLDSCHMGMTAIECEANGILFAAVHDSYWTHASTGEKLCSILRDQFVRLHKTNPISILKKEWESRYKIELSNLPEKGSLEIEQIKNSTYFFS